MSRKLLLVGDVFVDYTLGNQSTASKLRFGGIVHAARGAWAIGADYSVAAALPSYLEKDARRFLQVHGCSNFSVIGETVGSPNLMVIKDQLELGDQGYEDILRDARETVRAGRVTDVQHCTDILIVPGSVPLSKLVDLLPTSASIHIDIAYDIEDIDALEPLSGRLETLIISTSSTLFGKIGSAGLDELVAAVRAKFSCTIILKENRGGLRVVPVGQTKAINIPAILSSTRNSVGVGDAFDAAFVHFLDEGVETAAWKAGRVASSYAQTTYPDTFKEYVDQALSLTVQQMRDLGGVQVPWEKRPLFEIYLAAPDFSYIETRQIESAVANLSYHNFKVRRPVKENGELVRDSSMGELHRVFIKDVQLLKQCALVFAMPLGRDPGTLVEMGMAMECGIPVVTFDPEKLNSNTMVMVGSETYSDQFDECLNSIYTIISGLIR